jgi:hypothetical protein
MQRERFSSRPPASPRARDRHQIGMLRRGLWAAIPASEDRPHANTAPINHPVLVFMVSFVSPASHELAKFGENKLI